MDGKIFQHSNNGKKSIFCAETVTIELLQIVTLTGFLLGEKK